MRRNWYDCPWLQSFRYPQRIQRIAKLPPMPTEQRKVNVMAREAACPSCSQSFPADDYSHDAWLECPHCQERVVNLSALKSRESVWRGVIGGILLVLAVCGVLGWLLGMAEVIHCAVNYPPFRGDRSRLIDVALVASLLLPCGLLFLSGWLFVRAGARLTKRAPRTLGAAAALLLAMLFVGVIAFVHIATRFG